MKNTLIILFLLPSILFSQIPADKEYYLIDGLVLEELLPSDRRLLDSCLMVYHTSKQDTDRIFSLNGLCDFMVHESWSKYQFVQYELIEEALKKYKEPEIVRILEISLSVSLNNLGLFYEHQHGDIPKALEFYHKGLKINEDLENNLGIALLLNRTGAIYMDQGDQKRALENYQRSISLLEAIGNDQQLSNPLNSMGLYYEGEEDYESALKYFFKSLKIDEKVKNAQGVGMSLSNIGEIYLKYENAPKALNYFKRSLKVFEELGDKKGKGIALRNIGNVYLFINQIDKAYVFASKSLEIANRLGHPKRIGEAAALLSKVYEANNESSKALEMYKIAIKMRDSLNSENSKTKLIRQQSKFEYESQKAIDDAVHDKEIAIEQKAKEKQKILTYATGLVLSLVAIFLAFVFSRLRVTRKQKVIIEEAHEELSEKNKEILDSINYAKRIQTAILPPEIFVKEHLADSFIYYKPKDIVAGDFYWMKSVTSNGVKVISDEVKSTLSKTEESKLVLFAAADCTGHGVPGAMVSVVCNNALNRSIKEYGLTDPGKILDKTREIVIDEFSADSDLEDKTEGYVKDGMDIALCSLKYNVQSLESEKSKTQNSKPKTAALLQYAGANNPLWIIRDGEVLITKANKQPIGSFRSSEPFTTHSIELQKNDVVYIFSDGYVDQFGGEKGKKFMSKALKKLLLSFQDKAMDVQHTILNETFEAWKGNLDQVDDVCFIGVRI
ncbi:MAG: hypothetical protein COB15_15770 [Flavobacteriales bacterium]|nr:MAG: hypothetical protein COB15_15770 [Flavobacteriales bacterium]